MPASIIMPGRRQNKDALDKIVQLMQLAQGGVQIAEGGRKLLGIRNDEENALLRRSNAHALLEEEQAKEQQAENRGEFSPASLLKQGLVPAPEAPKLQPPQSGGLVPPEASGLNVPKFKSARNVTLMGGKQGTFYDPRQERQFELDARNAEQLKFNQNMAEKRFKLDEDRSATANKLGQARLQIDQQKIGYEKGKDRNSLAKDYNTDPTTRDTKNVSQSYAKIIRSSQNPSPAGDMSLLYGFMKLIDPGSTVREGEFATAEQTTNVPGYLSRLYNRALSGQRLTDEQRADFLNQAQKQFEGQLEAQELVDSQYKESARRLGVDDAFLTNFKGMESAQTQRTPQQEPGASPVRKTFSNKELQSKSLQELEMILKSTK